MSETRPQEPGTAPVTANTPRQWEWFWRIIAGLIVIIIGWVAWVMYQIMPRSVVTPLVYESQSRLIHTQQSASGTSAVAATQQQAGALIVQPTPEAAAADLAMDQAQAAMRAGGHQASADVQAAALTKGEEPARGEKLKLSTEITTPIAETRSFPTKNPEGQSGVAPSVPAADASGKTR